MNIRTPAALLAVSLLCLAACSPSEPRFDADALAESVRVLSSDDFAGRSPAGEAEQLTVAYLVEKLSAYGLEPGGPVQQNGSRTWIQEVPLMRSRFSSPLDIRVRAGRDELRWTQGEQVAIRAIQTGATELALADAPLVFVGYGVTAPERNWDDFKDVDLAGKVALILVNDPDYETGEGDFGGRAMTWYGRWTYKYEEAARRGAAGALVIHETGPASYGWTTVSNSNNDVFDVLRADPLAAHVPLEGWIHRDATVELLQRAGLSLETLKEQARTREFRPVELDGVKLSARFTVDREQVVSRNVIGMLPGRGHPDEWVLYSAHWDHLGVGEPDARGDTIYNGAVDNAAGVAQLLQIARAFAQAKPTQRSLGFLFVAAEEQGLLGSEYYADNPVYPLSRTVAVINTDSPRPSGPARDFSTSGDAPLTLQDTLIDTARAFQRSFTPDSRPEAGLFYRSDHFSFAKRGVPALSFNSGEDLREGGVAAGKAWGEAYTRDRYHQQADEFDPATWRFDGIVDDARLLYALGRRLADSREWPEWKTGAEFKAARDATAAERR